MEHLKLVWTIAAIVTLSVVVTSQTPTGHAIFEQALAKERVDGNIQEAIRLYERVVAEFASDRALAARALVQVGRCYEKLGREEAVRAYERLVRDFADQEDAVQQARARLATLKRPAPGPTTATTTPTVRAFPKVDSSNQLLSLSPDGTKAAYVNYDKGQNLGVYDVGSQQTTRLTDFDWTLGSFWMFDAAWSADGRRIAYTQCPNGAPQGPCELRVITLGGESTVIARERMRPGGWLPDGSAIAVTLVRPDRTATIGLTPTGGGSFIPLRSISGWTGQYPPLPSVSPDGRWIAFAEGSPGEIHVISRDGKTAHRVTDHPAEEWFPVWSPDGRHLAFLSSRGGIVGLWILPIRDGQPAADPVRVKDGMEGVIAPLGWTPRGIAYSQSQRTDDIYTVPVDPASGEPNGSPRLIPYSRTGHNVVPEWSPDGKYLAFVCASERDRRLLVLLPSGGGEPREFPLPHQTNVWGLRWFGDSRGLGFTGYDAKTEPTVFRLTLATGEWKTVPLNAPQPNNNRTEWNADGSRYFYPRASFTGEGPAIVEHDVQSGRERIVFRGKPTDFRYRSMRFSPDRRWLAMNEMPPDPAQPSRIVVLDLETGRTPVVYSAAGEAYPPESVTWAPGGRALLLQTRTEQRTMDLKLIPTDGGEVRRVPLGAELTRLLSPGRNTEKPTIESLVWSPDGTRLAFNLRASQLETWMIENPLALAGATGGSARK